MSNTNGHKPQEQNQPDGMLEVADIHEFVHHLTGWHGTKVAELRHLLKMPEGVEMETVEQEPKKVIMAGDILAGFKIGVEVALMSLGSLPFAAELEGADVH